MIGDDVRRIYAAVASGIVVLDAEARVVAANAAAEDILGLSLDTLRGQHLSSSSFWSGLQADGTPLPVAECPAMVAMRTRKPVRGVNIRLGRPDGTERWVQVDAVPIIDEAGAVERIVVSYVDLTARVRAEEEARVEAGRLAAIAAVQREVAASARDLDGLMSLVTERAQALTNAAGAAVELVEGDELVYRAASGMLAGSVGTRLALAGTLSSLCMNASEVLCCDDAGDDPRADRVACRRLGIGSMIVAPLAYEGRPIGVLKVAAPRPYAFDTRDMQTLELVTGVLAGALGRALAFAALRESEARFRALSEHGTDLLCILAPDGSALYGSPSYARVLGAPIEELHRLAGSPLGAIHPDDQAHVHAALLACVVEGQPSATLTCRHRHADGSWRTLECVATNQLGESAIGGIVVTSRDVTARMAAEEARTQLAAIVEASADAIIGKTLDGVITSWNHGAERLYGYSAAEAIGQNITVLAPPHRVHEVADLIAAVRQGESITQYETERVRKDGSIVMVAVTITPVRDGHGAVMGASVVARDITERARVEEARRASEERYRQIEAHAPIGLALVSPDGHWLRVNPALCALVGYAEDELLASTFQDITHPDDLDGDVAQVRQVLAGELDSYRMEKRYIRKDGSVVWALLSVSLVRDTAGEPLYFISQIQDIEARKRDEERLRHVAHHDALTGLPNRVLFNDRLGQALRVAERAGRPLAVLLIDLNGFKEVNDTLGHDAGDALLCVVATRMQGTLRVSDTVARLGGDEFAVLLPDTDDVGAMHAAAKLADALAVPADLDGRRVEVGGSVGIACHPRHGTDAATLLRHADVAMYEAKRGGGGRALYAPERDANTEERLALTADLRAAIAAGELELHYQPVVDLATGRPLALEALARWRHPARGLVMPDVFIPMAEETGAIIPLTDWALDAALAACNGWGSSLGVTVNIASRALHDAGLPDRIVALLARHGVRPEGLTLEITETALMRQPERVLAVLRRFKRIGVRLAIDDFGTGYSSLGVLQELPVDEIKIDRSFVRRADVEEQGLPIIAFILGLARSCHLHAVVEGVETPAMRLLLEALGCDAAQGYLFARPLPPDKLVTWLADAGERDAYGAA